MPTKGPVNVNKQTIHAIIPGLDYRAAKQIDKLRRLTIIGFSVVIGVGFGGYGIAYLLDQYNIVTLAIVVLIVAGVYLPIAAYLVRKWSIEWNKKFDQ
jgi:hypothetical protein